MSTCISRAFFGGSLQPTAGLVRIKPSCTARCKAVRQLACIPLSFCPKVPFRRFLRAVFFRLSFLLRRIAVNPTVTRNFSDFGNDMIVNAVFIVGSCGNAESVPAVGLIPEVDPIPERHIRFNFIGRASVLFFFSASSLTQQFFAGFHVYCVYHTYALFTFAPAADTLISTDTKYSEVIMKTRRIP